MNASVIAETLNTPVLDHYDVIVAGGGASGLIAAVAAARSGARVALVERAGCLGGTATSGMVAQYIGLFNGTVRCVGGIGFELTQRIEAAGGSDGFRRYTLAEASANPVTITNFPFNPEVVKIVADDMTREAGVDVLLHSRVVGPLMEDNRVAGLLLENVSGRRALRSRMLVDATGDAVIAAAAGIPYVGEEPDLRDQRQPLTLVFRMSNVDVRAFRAIPREQKRAIALDGLRRGQLAWESLSFCSTPGDTDAICLMSRIHGIDALDGAELTRAEQVGRQQIKTIVPFLREHVPGFERSVLAGIAERVGIRETRRIVGRHTLTTEDIVGGKRFADAVALGAGPMDLHEAGGTGVDLWMPPAPFEIPLACLLPQTIEGIVVTGRAISATREANGGARHMGTAMCLGHAAGAYAALAAGGQGTLDTPAIDTLHQTLRSQGALISADEAMAAADENAVQARPA
ncbi:MAG: FAD-dependent oxidoreductase [Alcaligenaceae bacterium]|nr:FAD-dependent oxidoreductase [Alcaligenaceae bacterium SAGV5]MPS54898.1 FAD-dependent oxidoreductase [Alcaligenaceae bacterium SAGV3]MPT56453.1 FAD-dependent oxidoreductase [Alcaligenaceae bacterium]